MQDWWIWFTECGRFVRQFRCCIEFTRYNKITVVAVFEIGTDNLVVSAVWHHNRLRWRIVAVPGTNYNVWLTSLPTLLLADVSLDLSLLWRRHWVNSFLNKVTQTSNIGHVNSIFVRYSERSVVKRVKCFQCKFIEFSLRRIMFLFVYMFAYCCHFYAIKEK